MLTYLQSGKEAEQRQSLCPAPWAVHGVLHCVGLSWGFGDILATRFWANSFRSLSLVSSTVEEVSVRTRCQVFLETLSTDASTRWLNHRHVMTASLFGGQDTDMRLQNGAAQSGHPALGGSFGINA